MCVCVCVCVYTHTHTLISVRRSKTNISLVPRAVTRKTEADPGNQQGSGSGSGLTAKDGKESNVTKMSNDDFRKLLCQIESKINNVICVNPYQKIIATIKNIVLDCLLSHKDTKCRHYQPLNHKED